MKIITRYVLGQVGLFFIVTVVAMSSAFMMYMISEATIAQGLPLYVSIRLIPYVLPYLLSITLPIATLLAASLVYGKMAGMNEMIALKAMGVAPWRVFLPTWILAGLVSLVAVWMNDLSVSWGDRNAARVAIEGTEAMLLGRLSAEGKFSDRYGNISLSVAGVTEDGVLLQPTFSGKKFPGEGIAERGRLTVDFSKEEPIIHIELTDIIFKSGQGTGLLPQKLDIEYPLAQIGFTGTEGDPPMAAIEETLRKVESERAWSRRKMAAKTAFALMTGDASFAGNNEWTNQMNLENHYKRLINLCRVATPRRTSSGFSCFFFAWIGIPVAVWLNRAEYLAGFFACFLPILIVYYPLFMGGLNGAKSGVLPPICCWSGNLVLAIAGFYFLKTIHRH